MALKKVLLLVLSLMATNIVYAQDRHIAALPAELGSSETARFLAWNDQALAGNPGYEYSATDAVIAYQITGDARYIRHAIELTDLFVAAEEERIAAGTMPRVASDSYLEVGSIIGDLALSYDWGYEFLTDAQKSRWELYADQAVWNVWNYNSAEWGGRPLPWSGWSTNNPGNNYFYSFVEATMLWGLAAQRTDYLDILRNEKFPLFTSYFSEFEGGGSREGTGYGASHKRLFRIHRIWRQSTNEEFIELTNHARASIDYWIHATTPMLANFAPIGDQSRVSNAPLYDYHRALVLEAQYANSNTLEAERAAWWLNNISVDQMFHGFNYKDSLLPISLVSQPPSDTVYLAKSAGHLFARSSWSKQASYLTFVAGLFDESHAHQDQGAFSIFQGDWLAVTENIHTRSGIQQGTDVHNVLLFVENGAIVRQGFGSQSTQSHSYNNGVLEITANLTPAYASSGAVSSWNRAISYSDPIIEVTDTYVTSGQGIETFWQINTPTQPILDNATGILTAGHLSIEIIEPESPVIEVIDWTDLDSSEYRSGWKLLVGGGTGTYKVRLTILDQTRPKAPTGITFSE